jgi:hypothetical protein
MPTVINIVHIVSENLLNKLKSLKIKKGICLAINALLKYLISILKIKKIKKALSSSPKIQ